MDLSLIMNTLMSADSLNNISKKTGSSKKEVSDVLVQALPLLLAGAKQQEDDENTADTFYEALSQHSKNDTSDMNSFFDGIDMADGAKIIGHLLGANTSSTTKKVSKSSGTSDDKTALILAAAAPLLMSLLGQETKKTKKSSKKTTDELAGQLLTAVLDNVDVGSLLMNALSTSADEEEKPKKKAATTKKKTTSAKTTTAKKKTASKSTTTAKKKTATKKKAADEDDGIDLADAASLLINLLK